MILTDKGIGEVRTITPKAYDRHDRTDAWYNHVHLHARRKNKCAHPTLNHEVSKGHALAVDDVLDRWG